MTDVARIRLTCGTRRPIYSGYFQPLVWDAADQVKNWPTPPSGPFSEIVLPYTGLTVFEVFDCDFGDSVDDPAVGAAGLVGDRVLVGQLDRNNLTIRASDARAPARGRTAFGYSRRIPVMAGQLFEWRVKHTSGITLSMCAVEAWVRYEEIEEL